MYIKWNNSYFKNYIGHTKCHENTNCTMKEYVHEIEHI